MTLTVRNRHTSRQSGDTVDTTLLKRIAHDVLGELGATEEIVGITLVSDRVIARLNKIYHATTGPTDVLSFDYGGSPRTVDVIVSVDRAISQARRFRTTPARELMLYVIHGLLHVYGHDDQTPAQRVRMQTAQRRLLRWIAGRYNRRGLMRRAVR